ncbi:MAG: hypothetical protein O9284_07665 [Steroidobacteraceae bacterium]|nr:hypothetical protein [Steroidobacteraceae bacterium]
MSANASDRERLAELAFEAALGTPSPEEAGELERLRAVLGPAAESGIDRAVAATLDAFGDGRDEALPAALRERVLRDADAYLAAARRAGPPGVMPVAAGVAARPRTAPRRRRRPGVAGFASWGGWAAACASLAFAVYVLLAQPPAAPGIAGVSPPVAPRPGPSLPAITSSGTASSRVAESASTDVPGVEAGAPANATVAGAAAPEESWREFVAARPYLIRRRFEPGPDAAGRRVSGEVIWDGVTQRGYMRFAGLRPNDRLLEQYQLWIFDAERDERYPVDGGVFDVDATGEVVIPIRAKLGVGRPVLFAVTVERRGGVVVSARERIAALARVT